MLDMADAELKSLRKNYNMERAPIELQEKVKVAVTMRFVRSFGSFYRTNKEIGHWTKYCCRFDIEDLFKKAETAFKTLAIYAPKEKAEELGAHITNLSERMEVRIMMYNVYDCYL